MGRSRGYGAGVAAPSRARADLRQRLNDPGFTPSVRDAGALVELLAEDDEDSADLAARALARIGAPLAPRAVALAEAESTHPRARARLVRVLGRLDAPEVLPFLLRAAKDDDNKTRRNALAALGRVRGDASERALLEAWQREVDAPILRTVATSLGKIGSRRALEALRAPPPATQVMQGEVDAELVKKVARASQMIARDADRSEASAIDAGAVAPNVGGGAESVPLLFFCRAGLQAILAEELGRAWGAVVARPGEVRATLRGPLSRVFASRTMTHVGFPLPLVAVDGDPTATDAVAAAVARALTGEHARALFEAFTRGPVRYRIALEGAGHKRALVWRVAELVQARAPRLMNDPRASTWHAQVRTSVFARAGSNPETNVEVVLVPRALDDPRFTYRVAEVPAASHPTIAAALALLGGAREDDVVWDPFVGSGLELVERARLGPYARLVGTDVDARALDAARANLDAARVGAELEHADALRTRPRGVTLILTNPPMGRRVQKQGELAPFLERFVAHAARVLVPGGRIVWASPRGADTRALAKSAGLVLDRAQPLLLGAHEAEIQRFFRP
jgi:23S rRNA G2445 N2-methylase RlmL